MAAVDGYTSIQVDSLTPHIGAQVSGVALGDTLSNEQFSEIYQAWLDWKRTAQGIRSSFWHAARTPHAAQLWRRS